MRVANPVEVDDLGLVAASASAAFPALGALVVVDFTRVLCLGPHGVAWVSSTLSDDAIGFVGQEGERILLRTYSAPHGTWRTRGLRVSLDRPL